MRKLYLIAALVLMAAPAHAQGFSFDYNGKNIRIDLPKNCKDISCISVKMKDNDDAKDEEPAPPPAAKTPPASSTASAPATAPAPAPAAPAVPAAPASNDNALQLPPPPPRNDTASVQPNNDPQPPVAPQVATPAPVAAPAAPAAPATATASATPVEAPKPAGLTPVGVWLTEKKEGRVRIVECGKNLCGYEVNEKTNANGKQVLVDMRPTKANSWSGRINDTRSGSTYDSNVTLRNADSLRVEGCAFGGMFCGGQTWKRVE